MRKRISSLLKRWVNFAFWLSLLVCFAFLLSQGFAPSGAIGDVIRHNIKNEIDATPMFYTEVEDSSVFDLQNPDEGE